MINDAPEVLVEAAITELRRIEAVDDSLSPSDPAHFDGPNAALIRGMYQQWASDAKSLLDRLANIEGFGPGTAAAKLHDAYGRTLAMLSISLDDMECARRAIAEGRLLSREEVRRELHLEAN